MKPNKIEELLRDCHHGLSPNTVRAILEELKTAQEMGERQEKEQWTTDWFVTKGLYTIWSETFGFMLANYRGGGTWSVEGKDPTYNSDTKRNWIEGRDVMNDPLWRHKSPLQRPKEAAKCQK